MKIPVLKDYQVLNKKHVVDFFLQGILRVLLVMPTGTGKTTVFSSLAKDWSDSRKKVMIIVHRLELVDQIVERLSQFGIQAGLIMSGGSLNARLSVQVAMVQSLPADLDGSWSPDYIIIDECHHSTADSYSKLWRLFPNAKILGVTATPIRLDKKSFAEQYQEMIDLFPITWYIEKGYLVKPKHYVCSDINEELEQLRVVNGEYDFAQMSKVMRQNKRIAHIIESYQRYIPNRRAVVFAVNVDHSLDIVRRFNECGIPAAHLDGKTDKWTRNSIVNGFREGKYKVLSNYDIVSEGFDVPAIEASIFARKSKSRSFWIQGMGRCLRPDVSSDKKFGYILDCCNIFLDHGFAGMNYKWSLEGDESDEIIKKSRLFMTNNKGRFKSIIQPHEDPGLELCQLNEEMERLLMFDTFLKDVIVEEKALVEAVRRYEDYLRFQGHNLTKFERRYCEGKLSENGGAVSSDVWKEFDKVS